MLGACISTYLDATISKIIRVLMSKESIPVTCPIQQEGTLMSVLGYIFMATPVSSSYCVHLNLVLITVQLWFNFCSLYYLAPISDCLCILQVVKNWNQGRPGNEAMCTLSPSLQDSQMSHCFLYSCTSRYQSSAYRLNINFDSHLYLCIFTCYWCHLDERWWCTEYRWSEVQNLPDSDR